MWRKVPPMERAPFPLPEEQLKLNTFFPSIGRKRCVGDYRGVYGPSINKLALMINKT